MQKSIPLQQEHAFTISEIAQKFKISVWTVRRLIANGTFRATRSSSGKNAKLIVSARSVFVWLEGTGSPSTDSPIAIAAPREIIALSSIPFMSAEERAEIEERRASGELVEQFINGLPALVPAPVGK